MIEKYNEQLKPGDIILFKGSAKFKPAQYLIKVGGLLSQQKHGHYDTIHAGICIGHDEKGYALMAHVSRSKKGFTIETIDELFIRDKEKRNFFVFRPDEPIFANLIVSTINEHARQNIKTYSILQSLLSAFTQTKKNKSQKNIDKYTEDNYCSKFVLETLEMAGNSSSLLEKYKPEIKTQSLPKDLESYLTKRHGQYEHMFCNPNNSEGIVIEPNKAEEQTSLEMKTVSNDKKGNFSKTG